MRTAFQPVRSGSCARARGEAPAIENAPLARPTPAGRPACGPRAPRADGPVPSKVRALGRLWSIQDARRCWRCGGLARNPGRGGEATLAGLAAPSLRRCLSLPRFVWGQAACRDAQGTPLPPPGPRACPACALAALKRVRRSDVRGAAALHAPARLVAPRRVVVAPPPPPTRLSCRHALPRTRKSLAARG